MEEATPPKTAAAAAAAGGGGSRPVKGGVRTLPFIIANEVLEKVSTLGLQLTIILYLTREYHMGVAAGSTTLFIWLALTNTLPMFGAFLSDGFVGRFSMILVTSFACLLGMTMLWLTAILPGAKPPACKQTSEGTVYCPPALPQQLTLLYSAFILISIGSSGIRPCSLPFGADQFSSIEPGRRGKILQVYFNVYYASVGLAFGLSSTAVVYVQDKMGWRVGLGVPMVLMALSVFFFLVGSPLYIKINNRKSIATDFAQVIVAAARNRNLPKEAMVNYHLGISSSSSVPSNKLRFFNRACVIKDPDSDVSPESVAADPWRLCTVAQVEDFKSVIKVLPMWSSGIILSMLMSQNFPVLQAETMNRHLGRKFQIPAASLSVFQLLTLSLWSGCYDSFILPVIVKITRNPSGLTLKQRMGIGILFAVAGSAVAATVEAVRRKKAIEEGAAISALWLAIQYVMMGLAEAFNVIAEVEFFYSELPASMSSFAVALWTLGFGVANMLSALIVKVIDGVTGRGGSVSWLANDLNKGHFDYYYIVLMVLGAANFFYFLLCAWSYGEVGKKKPWEVEEEVQLQTAQGDDEQQQKRPQQEQGRADTPNKGSV